MICTTRRPKTKAVYFPHIGNIMNEFFNTPINEVVRNGNRNVTNPAVNVLENEDRFLVELAVPGHSKKDIRILIENDVLSIKSIISDETEESDYRLREFNFSGFERRFTLPESVDQSMVDASFKNGILSITLNKKEEAKPVPPKSITIK